LNEIARAVLYKVLIRTYKVSNGAWGQRVYSGFVPAKTPRPYLVILPQAGGQVDMTLADDWEGILTIKCVDADFETAMHGAALIEVLTNNTGVQDRLASGAVMLVNTSTEWQISYSSKELDVSFVEEFENSVQIYHEGAQYRFRLERFG
jgi:hypothetical protein